jgi:hypothetical protein
VRITVSLCVMFLLSFPPLNIGRHVPLATKIVSLDRISCEKDMK